MIPLVVLNYNGRALLEECLPSIVAAAKQSRHACRVFVIDNSSIDDSRAFLRSAYPEITVFEEPNRGLCSFNTVLPRLDAPVALLLNNDVKLAVDAVDPLLAPLVEGPSHDPRCFMTAPRCVLFDGRTYEGLRTAVRWRWGLVQATALFPSHEAGQFTPGFTASAGAVFAVRRDVFLELGGFDPLYLPGRLEDLDFAFRAYRAGYHARYVPEALAQHRGHGTFESVHGETGSLRLALRNTLLFQWKNLRRPSHVVRHVAGLAVRLCKEAIEAPLAPSERRFMVGGALIEALRRYRQTEHPSIPKRAAERELEFFRQFDYRAMTASPCIH